MTRTTVVLLATTVLLGLTNSASSAAQKALISAPLPTAHMLVCSCTNLNSMPMDIKFTFYDSTSGTSNDFTIQPGGTQQYVAGYSLNPGAVDSANCMVRRVDGKATRTRHLHCTLSTIDESLNINAVVPVNKTFMFNE